MNRDWNQILSEYHDIYSMKITTSGSIIYVGMAKIGTSQSEDKWQCKKIDSTDANNIIITWAGNGKFNQIATDLTTLTYS